METRRVLTAASLVLTLLLSGCGGGTLFVTTGSDGANIIVVSGTCTSVQTLNIVGNGGFVLVTSVTLFNNGLSSTFNFCGNLTGQFPMNSFVTVRYTSASNCATPTSIVIG